LLENGRALVEERENTNKAIEAGNKNTEDAIRATNESTKEAIAATFKATKLAIFWGLVGAIGGALLAVLFAHVFEARRLKHVDEVINQALAEQKKQTTIQNDLGQKADKLVKNWIT
jgi:cell division septal protein FtsQ